MNEGDAALKLALELMHLPSRVRHARAEPLPNGISDLLRVAAGDEAKAIHAASVLEREPDLVATAARFFVEQVLLAPDADCYRILGAERTATAADLRRNMALILRVLHPDVEREGLSVLAGRVTGAWDHLKTSERRDAYDRLLSAEAETRARRKPAPRRIRRRQKSRAGWLVRLVSALGLKS